MVSLVEHATDERAPTAAAWLLTGSVAFVLVGLVATMRSLKDFDRMPGIYRPVAVALLVGAGLVLLTGWARPVPWLLVTLVAAVPSIVWGFAVDRWLRNRMVDDSLGHPS